METDPVENKAMDPVIQTTVGAKRNNKENARPANGRSVSVAKKALKNTTGSSTRLLTSKNDKNGERFNKQADELKKPKTQTVQEARASGKGTVNKRQTLSQAFLSQHAIQQKKLVQEVVKPPASLPPKPLPGTYKGRVIQSKINSFRKPAGDSGEAEPTAAPTKPNGDGKLQAGFRIGGKPPAATPKLSTLKTSATHRDRSKSVSNYAPAPTAKRAQNATAVRDNGSRVRLHSAPCHLAKSCVRVPPGRPTLGPESTARPGSSKSTGTLKRKEAQQVCESKAILVAAATEKKAPKPPVTSSLSRYRTTMETAEERKAKLTDWLASRGKTLKRPPIPSTRPRTVSRPAPSKPLPKLEAAAKKRQDPETEPVNQQDSHLDKQLEEQPKSSPELAAKPESGLKAVPETTPCSSTNIMNTTLDLLENSEMDLPVDPEIRVDGVVANLCNAMEALQGPSSCVNDAQAQGDYGGGILEEDRMDMLAEISKEEVDLENEMHGIKEVKDRKSEEKSLAKKGVKTEFEDEVDGDEEDRSETPLMEAEGASVVKYSVKTTPYLQSVKRRIQSEVVVSGSGGRRRSAINDMKFLTPVRRSVRINRKSSHLPGMLTDHDPCVSSLAELVKLDDNANAYIYRKNPALLGDLPDQPEDLEGF